MQNAAATQRELTKQSMVRMMPADPVLPIV